jgi:glycosyltransferase involved in cell wall biosynthesis
MRPFLDRLEDRLLSDADAVVTVSDGVARLIERLSGRCPAIIRNCQDDRCARAPAADLRARLHLTKKDRLCVLVGNYKRGMAVRVAVAAMALLPARFHLAFLGRGYERADFGGIEAGLAGRIHFGQEAAADEIVETIRSADLGLVLYEPISENYRHALPNGFFQVVAAGLPVVRAKLPEIEAVIGDYRIGRCLAALTPEALAAAILHAEQNGAGFRAAGAALGRELRWENEAHRLVRLIDALMPERVQPSRVPVAAAG